MSSVCENRSKRIERTDLTANEIASMFYDYAIKCLKSHDLDVDEYHGDVCIKLCELARDYGNVKNMNSFYHMSVHQYIHNIIKLNENKARYTTVPMSVAESIGITYNLEDKCLWDSLELAMGILTEREKLAIKLYYNSACETFDDVADELGCGRERAYQITKKAIFKLRIPSRRKYLEDYLYI